MCLVKQSPKGYTLIEVMVALFIFALATSMVATALIESQKNQTELQQRTHRFIQIQRAMTLLANDLVQATAKLEQKEGRYIGSFFANQQEATWVRRGHMNPQWLERTSSLRKVHYTFSDNTWFRTIEQPNQSQHQGVPILESVSSVEWTYYDTSGNAYALWPPVQELSNQIPSLVRVGVTLEDHGLIERVISLPGRRIAYETE